MFSGTSTVVPASVTALIRVKVIEASSGTEPAYCDIGPNGQVKDASAYGHVEKKLRKACARNGLVVRDWFASVTPGGEGTREFFLHATPAAGEGSDPP